MQKLYFGRWIFPRGRGILSSLSYTQQHVCIPDVIRYHSSTANFVQVLRKAKSIGFAMIDLSCIELVTVINTILVGFIGVWNKARFKWVFLWQTDWFPDDFLISIVHLEICHWAFFLLVLRTRDNTWRCSPGKGTQLLHVTRMLCAVFARIVFHLARLTRVCAGVRERTAPMKTSEKTMHLRDCVFCVLNFDANKHNNAILIHLNSNYVHSPHTFYSILYPILFVIL